MKAYQHNRLFRAGVLLLSVVALLVTSQPAQQPVLAQGGDPLAETEATSEPTEESITLTPRPVVTIEISPPDPSRPPTAEPVLPPEETVAPTATSEETVEPTAVPSPADSPDTPTPPTDPVAAPEETGPPTATPEQNTKPTPTPSPVDDEEPPPISLDYDRPISEPPLMFVENVGQFSTSSDEEAVRFQVNLGRTILHLADNAIWLTLFEQTAAATQPGSSRSFSAAESPPNSPRRGVHLKLTFPDAGTRARLEPFNRLATHVSYFSGNDPANWHGDVPVWAGVRYIDLYPGLDLEITGQQGRLVQRLVVRESDRSNPDEVRLRIEGADSLSLDHPGLLRLDTSAGQIDLPLLQLISPDGTPLDRPGLPTIIEPNLVAAPFAPAILPELSRHATLAAASGLLYSTFLGGSGGEDSMGIAVDEAGSAYITGMTNSIDFPAAPGVFDPGLGGSFGAYVAKLNPGGTALEYAAYLDGGSGELSYDIDVDATGHAYVTGYTRSPDFPTTPGAYKTAISGLTDAFVVKLNPTGAGLDYGTFIGGSYLEWGFGLTVDESGSAYVAGVTTSSDYPTTPGAFQPGPGGEAGYRDAFVFKLNPGGSNLEYSTYLAGTGNESDEAYAVATDGSGNAYVTGQTESVDFPTTPGAFQTSFRRAFVLKLNLSGSDLVYGSFLGGNGVDVGRDITVDEAGHAFVAGDTTSNNFPTTPGAFQPSYHPGSIVTRDGDVFVVKMTPDGSALVYGTYLGGSDHDNGFGLEIDWLGRAYVTGSTLSNDFPTTPDGFQLSRLGSDAFVAKLNTTGSDLTYGSFLGGGFSETGWAIAPDDQGHAYVTGRTSSSDFPVTDGAFDTLNEDFRSDAFVTKLDTGNEPEPPPTPIPTPVPAHSCAPTLLGEISVGDEPRGIAVDPARQRVYVANFGSHSVSVIDSSNNTVIRTISGINSANGITHDPTHNVIWVTSYSHAQVVPIQANAGATVFSVGSPVAVGQGPWGVAYEPVHDFVYVANSLDNTVTVVNAATDTVVDTLEGSFDQPFHLAANPVSGQVYVSNFGNARVTVLAGAAVSRIVELWDSGQPYGIAVDETRDLIYVATVAPHRIVVIGPIRGVPDQFYGWAAFHRGFGDPRRPVPLRMLAVNPEIGPPGDGGHVWATTAALDGSEANQLLFIPKGWGGYFHWPLPTDVGDRPTDGLAIDRLTDRVYVSSGLERGRVSVIGDHIDRCPTPFAASAARQATEGDSPAEQDGSAGMDQIGVEIFEGELSNPEPPDQPGSTVTGIIELQGRTDHSGTQLFLSEQPCQTVTETTAPAGVTDARGQFALNIETAGPAAYLCVVQPGYLAGEISIPLGGGERITLPAGDVTGDDQIDVADAAALAALFGTGDPGVDLNADGKVDIFDLVLIASNYNRRGPVR